MKDHIDLSYYQTSIIAMISFCLFVLIYLFFPFIFLSWRLIT